MNKSDFEKASPKFKVGDVVKILPVSLIKEISSIDTSGSRVPDGIREDGYCYNFTYYFKDHYWREFEFNLVDAKGRDISKTHDAIIEDQRNKIQELEDFKKKALETMKNVLSEEYIESMPYTIREFLKKHEVKE